MLIQRRPVHPELFKDATSKNLANQAIANHKHYFQSQSGTVVGGDKHACFVNPSQDVSELPHIINIANEIARSPF